MTPCEKAPRLELGIPPRSEIVVFSDVNMELKEHEVPCVCMWFPLVHTRQTKSDLQSHAAAPIQQSRIGWVRNANNVKNNVLVIYGAKTDTNAAMFGKTFIMCRGAVQEVSTLRYYLEGLQQQRRRIPGPLDERTMRKVDECQGSSFTVPLCHPYYSWFKESCLFELVKVFPK
jgi:hypothetical protein